MEEPLERDPERAFALARDTEQRIAPFVRRTPLVESAAVAGRLLKLETLQRTGSFKVRGAAAALTAGGERPRLAVAASTGNHGLAVAAVSTSLGVRCRIFVPAQGAPAKLALLRASGAELVEVEGEALACELAARADAQRTPGALLVPPYNDPRVVLGQATVGLELLEQCAQAPQALYAAVGGGGLISGLALAVAARWPSCRIVGCVPAASAAMREAVAAGEVVAAAAVHPTLSDATAGNVESGTVTLPICAALVNEWVSVAEREIAAAMRAALLEEHLLLEGAAAVALAAAAGRGGEERQVVVASGGNVGTDTLRRIL